ncbi:hypothetical protein Tco_0905755, partial [Tanacetum coccineum]
ETSLSEYDEVAENILYFNDLFPFNINYPDDLKSDKDNDDDKIDIIQLSEGNINTQGANKLLEESHDKTDKVFIMEDFIMELNVHIVVWNYLVNGMLFNLIKNLYVPIGILFDPKRYYKDGVYTRMLQRPRDQRYQYLRFEGLQYINADIADFEMRLAKINMREVHRVHVFDFRRLTDLMVEGLRGRMLMEHTYAQGQSMFTSRAWRRLFKIRGLLKHELIREFFSTFRDLMLRLCHKLIACSIARRSQAHEKVTVIDLFYLRGMDVGSVNVPYLLARYLRLFASGRKQGAMIFEASGPDRQQAPQPPHPVAGPARTMEKWLARVEEDVHEIRRALASRARYTSYADFQIPYVRHTRRRTDDVNTSTAQQGEQQPNP